MWITTRDERAERLDLGVFTGTQFRARVAQLAESRIDSYGSEPGRELKGPYAATSPVPGIGTPPHQERPDRELGRPVGEPAGGALVWRSPRSGAVLSRGRALTQQQAIHAILTHSRNEIIQGQTTATRITYRTPAIHGNAGSVCVYEGSAPGLAPSIPAQNSAPSRGESRAAGSAPTTAAPGRVSVRQLAEVLGVDTEVAGDMLTELQNRRRDLGQRDWPELTIVRDDNPRR